VVIDLKHLVDDGNLLLNLEVRGGDIITVPPRSPDYVYVLGYVQRPGAYELKDGVRVDALRAVALAGGLSPAARAENSYLVRETAKGQLVVPVDLTKIAR
jgi:protein involved in polysaccharide export with SLBB domain